MHIELKATLAIVVILFATFIWLGAHPSALDALITFVFGAK